MKTDIHVCEITVRKHTGTDPAERPFCRAFVVEHTGTDPAERPFCRAFAVVRGGGKPNAGGDRPQRRLSVGG